MKQIFKDTFLFILIMIMLSPLYVVFVNTFKSRSQIFDTPFAIAKSEEGGLFQYYIGAMEQMDYFSALGNSLFISIASILLIIFTSSLAAWALVRNNWISSKIIFGVFVACLLIPFQTIMIPMVQWYKVISEMIGLPMLDTRFGLIFSYIGFGAGLSIFLFYGFIKSIPKELEEAAIMDGLGHWKIYTKIIFPLLKPITMTVTILNLIWIWNDYLLPSILIQDVSKRTIPLSTFFFFGEYNVQWGFALSGLVLSIIPVMIFYLFAQKYIVKGVADGAIK